MDIQSEFTFTGDNFKVTDDMMKSFNEYGYIIVRSVAPQKVHKIVKQAPCLPVPLPSSRSLLSKEELDKLQTSLESDGGIINNAFEMADGQGKNSRLSIWSHPGEDVTGMLARSEKVVTTSEEVIYHSVYH